MNILASIKAEKKMSFNHWRYKLLHWTFNETAKTPRESDLPGFLYTHYCPLFHLTNLIAVLFPIILTVKLVVGLVIGIGKCCKLIGDAIGMLPWETVGNFFAKIKKALTPEKKVREPRQPTDAELAAERLKREKKELLTYMLRLTYGEDQFDRFWDHYGYEFREIQKEQAEAFYVTRMAKIIATKKRVEEKKERMRQRLIFWTNFSHVFLKWFFNICYVLLAVFVAWVLYKIVPPCIFGIIDFVKFLFTFEIMPVLIFLGTWLVRIGVVGGAFAIVIWGFWRFQLIRKCGAALGSSLVAVSPPFVLVGGWCLLPFKWIAAAFNNTVEFIEMFYKENCPPIEIISGEDEQIANELNDIE